MIPLTTDSIPKDSGKLRCPSRARAISSSWNGTAERELAGPSPPLASHQTAERCEAVANPGGRHEVASSAIPIDEEAKNRERRRWQIRGVAAGETARISIRRRGCRLSTSHGESELVVKQACSVAGAFCPSGAAAIQPIGSEYRHRRQPHYVGAGTTLATLRKPTKPVEHPRFDPPRRIRVADIRAMAWEAQAAETSTHRSNPDGPWVTPRENSAQYAGHHSSVIAGHHGSALGDAQMRPHQFNSGRRTARITARSRCYRVDNVTRAETSRASNRPPVPGKARDCIPSPARSNSNLSPHGVVVRTEQEFEVCSRNAVFKILKTALPFPSKIFSSRGTERQAGVRA